MIVQSTWEKRVNNICQRIRASIVKAKLKLDLLEKFHSSDSLKGTTLYYSSLYSVSFICNRYSTSIQVFRYHCITTVTLTNMDLVCKGLVCNATNTLQNN